MIDSNLCVENGKCPTMARWNTREKSGQWKGGRTIASNGYVLIRVGKTHHLADVRGYAYEHRLVAEAKLGRRLKPDDEVHHMNGNRLDNSPNNIEILSHQAHRMKHRSVDCTRRLPDEENPLIECACGCGKSFLKYDSYGRARTYLYRHQWKSKYVE